MPKYEFDAMRWLRNVAEVQSHRAGAGPAMLRKNMLECADEIERLRLRAEQAEKELAALKAAARPVVNACHAADADGELDDRIDGQALFELARLVGEE